MIQTRTAILLAIMFWVFLPGSSADGETLKGLADSEESGPIVIKSQSLELDEVQKRVTFTGDVTARRDDFVIDCQEMIVHYAGSPGEEETGGPGTKIEKIEASGSVKITRAQGGTATAGRAVYYQLDEKVVLTEDPMVKQGEDFVQGDRITLFLKENRSLVESLGDRKVKAVIHPREEKE